MRITASEWGIMEVLWHQAPLSAAEVFERLAGKTSWNIGTVRAFLDRLEQKKAVRKEDVIPGYKAFTFYHISTRKAGCKKQACPWPEPSISARWGWV